MRTIDIYSILNFEPVKAEGFYIWDKEGNKYLDFYGGHAVISIGHRHPHWVSLIKAQLDSIPFYSNAVPKTIEQTMAAKLGELSGYQEHSLFLCNSGAEANENALKAASYVTGRSKVICFEKAFHGRTSAAVAVSGYAANITALNATHNVVMLPLNNQKALENELAKNDTAAVIIEGIQGVAGIIEPDTEFVQAISRLCKTHGALLIEDEVQSGMGRTGKFFAHQHSGIVADMVTIAKGIGNGFPLAAVLIGPNVKLAKGQLGSTFGGNHMACAAAQAVLDVIKKDNLIDNAATIGEYLKTQLAKIPQIKQVRGRGLMLALEFDTPVAPIRNNLVYQQKLLTGHAGTYTIRLLPSLNIGIAQADDAIERIKAAITAIC